MIRNLQNHFVRIAVFFFALALFPAAAQAGDYEPPDEIVTYDGITYEVHYPDEDEVDTATAYVDHISDDAGKNVTVPATITLEDGTTTADVRFYRVEGEWESDDDTLETFTNDTLETLTVKCSPDNTEISDFPNLKKVTFVNGVLEFYASYCPKLADVELGVTKNDDNYLASKDGDAVIIYDYVSDFGRYGFLLNYYPEGATANTFHLSNDVGYASGYLEDPFSGNTNLEAITVDADNPYYKSVDGVLFSADGTILYKYPSGKKDSSYTLPDSVTTIANDAFFNTVNLKTLYISDNSNLTSIGDDFNRLYQKEYSLNTDFMVYCSEDSPAYDLLASMTTFNLNDEERIHYCKDHVTYHPGKDATCGEAGVEPYYLCTCGKIYDDAKCTIEYVGDLSDMVLNPTGKHTWKSVTTKATLKKDGTVKTVCSVCGTVKGEETVSMPKTVKLSKTSYTYSGKAVKPTVKVTDAAGNTISSQYYTVKYDSGRKKVGKYTVKVTFRGNYSGTKKLTFTIKPKGTSVSKVTAGSKKITVKWKKQTKETTGYQIQYSLKKNFGSAKIVTVNKNKTTSKSITKLKAKKKYYVRIRTYKTVSGKKYVSSWSKAKTVTTKK